MQEGTARLTIDSDEELSLGQCLRLKYKHEKKPYLYDTGAWAASVPLVVFLGNTALQWSVWEGSSREWRPVGMTCIYAVTPFPSNCLAGGIDAAMALPGLAEIKNYDIYIRAVICSIYTILVVGLILKDHFSNSDLMGYFMSGVMIAMLVLFIIIASMLGGKEKLATHR